MSPDIGVSLTQASPPGEQRDPSAGGYVHTTGCTLLFLPASPKVVCPVGKRNFHRGRRHGFETLHSRPGRPLPFWGPSCSQLSLVLFYCCLASSASSLWRAPHMTLPRPSDSPLPFLNGWALSAHTLSLTLDSLAFSFISQHLQPSGAATPFLPSSLSYCQCLNDPTDIQN